MVDDIYTNSSVWLHSDSSHFGLSLHRVQRPKTIFSFLNQTYGMNVWTKSIKLIYIKNSLWKLTTSRELHSYFYSFQHAMGKAPSNHVPNLLETVSYSRQPLMYLTIISLNRFVDMTVFHHMPENQPGGKQFLFHYKF